MTDAKDDKPQKEPPPEPPPEDDPGIEVRGGKPWWIIKRG